MTLIAIIMTIGYAAYNLLLAVHLICDATRCYISEEISDQQKYIIIKKHIQIALLHAVECYLLLYLGFKAFR